MTSADELRELLDRSEKRVANLRGSGADAAELLLDMDRIDELWPELEALGGDLRPEAGRWETIQAQLRRSGPRLLRELRTVGGLDQVRTQQQGTSEASLSWWWHLDKLVREDTAARMRRNGLILAGVVILVGAAWLIMRIFFPVDPQVQAAMSAQTAGEQKIMNGQDYAGALADFQAAATHTPEEPEVWLRVGVTLEQLGDTRAAQENYDKALALTANETQFHLARANIYLSFQKYDSAYEDVQAVLAAEPRNAVAYYYLGSIYEGQNKIDLAIGALEKASEYADESNQSELVALARYRMAMMYQQAGLGDMREPEPTLTPTPGS